MPLTCSIVFRSCVFQVTAKETLRFFEVTLDNVRDQLILALTPSSDPSEQDLLTCKDGFAFELSTTRYRYASQQRLLSDVCPLCLVIQTLTPTRTYVVCLFLTGTTQRSLCFMPIADAFWTSLAHMVGHSL